MHEIIEFRSHYISNYKNTYLFVNENKMLLKKLGEEKYNEIPRRNIRSALLLDEKKAFIKQTNGHYYLWDYLNNAILANIPLKSPSTFSPIFVEEALIDFCFLSPNRQIVCIDTKTNDISYFKYSNMGKTNVLSYDIVDKKVVVIDSDNKLTYLDIHNSEYLKEYILVRNENFDILDYYNYGENKFIITFNRYGELVSENILSHYQYTFSPSYKDKGIEGISISSDGRYLAIRTVSNLVLLYSLESFQMIKSFNYRYCYYVGFSQDNERLLIGTGEASYLFKISEFQK